MKLEHTLTRFVSLGPKIYGGIDENSQSFTKIKGLKNKITFNQLNESLIKPTLLPKEENKMNPSLQASQEKWDKSLIQGTIEVKQKPYILTPKVYGGITIEGNSFNYPFELESNKISFIFYKRELSYLMLGFIVLYKYKINYLTHL